MNLAVSNPNFSIVVPGDCNCNCAFCFNKSNPQLPEEKMYDYLSYLDKVLQSLPKEFFQISLTGGEPTISPYFIHILQIIKKYKSKFPKVVLSTNGYKLLENLNHIDGIVDHINISRHHFDDIVNKDIFDSEYVIDSNELKEINSKSNKLGIDVTLSAVLYKNGFYNINDIITYIEFAKKVGANHVKFRKEHGNSLAPTMYEQYFDNYKTVSESECPACRTKTQYINGISVIWTTSVIEPSDIMTHGIYELVFNSNGVLYSDWNMKNNLHHMSQNKQSKDESNDMLSTQINRGCEKNYEYYFKPDSSVYNNVKTGYGTAYYDRYSGGVLYYDGKGSSCGGGR